MVNFASMPEDEKEEIAAEHKEKKAGKLPSLGDLRMYVCPPLWITKDTRDLIDSVFIFDDMRLLPFRGTWTEQPAWFIQAFKIYKSELSKFKKSEA